MRTLGSSLGSTIVETIGRAAGRVQENRSLPADVLESDDAYLIVFDAPGATAADAQVRFVDDRVEVRLDRFREFYDEFEMRYPGRGMALAGDAGLPEDAAVDAARATATMREDGTLHVRVPKVDAADSDGAGHREEPVDDAVEEADERASAGATGADVADETDE